MPQIIIPDPPVWQLGVYANGYLQQMDEMPPQGPIFQVNLAQGSTNSNGFTSNSIDTSNCNFLGALVSQSTGSATITLTDSNSNTWIGRTVYQSPGGATLKMWHVFNPTVGTGHTFTTSGTGNFASLFVIGFSGLTAGFQTGTDSGAHATSTTIQPGSITPSNSPALVLSGWAGRGGTLTGVDSSFVIPTGGTVTFSASHHYGGSFAYLIQSTAAAVNPTWTEGTSEGVVANIAAFQ